MYFLQIELNLPHAHQRWYLFRDGDLERVLSTRSPSMKFSEFRLYMLPRPSSQRLQHVRVFFSSQTNSSQQVSEHPTGPWTQWYRQPIGPQFAAGSKEEKKKVKECSIAYDGRSWASRRSNGSCYLQRGITRNDFIFRILQPSVQACQTMFKKEFVLSMHRAKSLISDGMQEWIDNLL